MRFVGGGGGISWVSALRLANACDEGVVMLAVSTCRDVKSELKMAWMDKDGERIEHDATRSNSLGMIRM